MLPYKKNKRTIRLSHPHDMSREEVSRLFGSCTTDSDLVYKAVLSLCFFRGLRILEAVSVQLQDFSDDFGYVAWRDCKVRSKVYREPLPRCVSEIIRLYVARNWQRINFEGYLFHPNSVGHGRRHPHITACNVQSWMRKKAEKLGMNDFILNDPGRVSLNPARKSRRPRRIYRISTHCGKRFFGTNAYLLTKDGKFVQNLLHHASQETTFKHYILAAEKAGVQKGVIEQIAQVLEGRVLPETQTRISAYDGVV